MRTGPHDYGPREWCVFFFHLHTRTLIFRTAHAVGASLMRASLVPGPAPDRQQETDRTLGSRRTLHNYIRINQACATRAL